MKSIRGAYEERGVESFYRERGHLYQNPHSAQQAPARAKPEPRMQKAPDRASKTHAHTIP